VKYRHFALQRPGFQNIRIKLFTPRERHRTTVFPLWPKEAPLVGVYSPRQLRTFPAHPFLHSMPPSTSSSYHPSSCCLATSHKQSERLPSPRPPFPRPSFSPPLLRPSLLPLHSMPCCTTSCIVQCAMVSARVRSGPREHQRRARSDDEVPWSPSSVDYRHSALACDRIDKSVSYPH
jgi:hypothetical protein